MPLSLQQIRVLGALIEKEITTPDLYPLSQNSLQAACNQRSSRDPVLDLTEDEIRTALHQLEDAGLASPARASLNAPLGRVSKFEHHARTALNLRRDEIAVLCLLLLRGPQTPGELRARADRLYTFDDLAAMTATLDRLAAQPAPITSTDGSTAIRPLIAILPRQPGSRESRYRHLLGLPGDPTPNIPTQNIPTQNIPGQNDPTQRESAPNNSISAFTATPSASVPAPHPATRTPDLEARLAALEQRVLALERHLATHPHQPSPPPASLAPEE